MAMANGIYTLQIHSILKSNVVTLLHAAIRTMFYNCNRCYKYQMPHTYFYLCAAYTVTRHTTDRMKASKSKKKKKKQVKANTQII